MNDTRAAYRYALALIGVSEEQKGLERVTADFEFIQNIIKEVKEFSLFLKNPIINKEKKKKILTELLAKNVSDLTLKFVMLLASKGREGLLHEVIRQFYSLREERLGILKVTARTAVRFTPEQEEKLVNNLERVTKKKVRINYIEDPSLKGGFTVEYGDTVWDASLRHQLAVLEQRFARG